VRFILESLNKNPESPGFRVTIDRLGARVGMKILGIEEEYGG
jgi:hypothetical protein